MWLRVVWVYNAAFLQHYAARSGHVAVCQMLLRHGADVNIQTRAGGATPLHRAAYCGHHQVVQLLLDRKAEVLRIDADGQTATHKASWFLTKLLFLSETIFDRKFVKLTFHPHHNHYLSMTLAVAEALIPNKPN